VKLAIPLDIIEQHLLFKKIHANVGKMIVDETPTRE